MNKYIILNYYSDKNIKRKNEILYCIQKNLLLKFINHVIIFLDKQEDKNDVINLKNSKKCIFVNLNNKNLLFNDIINYCSQKIPKNSICIVVNADIFLENSNSWKFIDRDFFNKGFPNKTLVCHRRNLFPQKVSKINKLLDKVSTNEGDFCDAWVFKTPLQKNFLKENFNFTLFGSPAADPLVMGLMVKNYHVYHWGNKFIVYHYDVVRKANKNLPKAFHLVAVNNRTDPSALMRINESVKIPIFQNWQYFLSRKKKPVFIFLKDDKYKIITLTRKIYIFFLILYKKILFYFK